MTILLSMKSATAAFTVSGWLIPHHATRMRMHREFFGSTLQYHREQNTEASTEKGHKTTLK